MAIIPSSVNILPVLSDFIQSKTEQSEKNNDHFTGFSQKMQEFDKKYRNFEISGKGENGELLFRCKALKENGSCGVYRFRSVNCRLYPRINQKFVYIPFNNFVNMLAYKCENVGIKFILTEESYTSGTSFLDNEEPCKENHNKNRRKYK